MEFINSPVAKKIESWRLESNLELLHAPMTPELGSGPAFAFSPSYLHRAKLKRVFALGLQQLFGFIPPGMEAGQDSAGADAALSRFHKLEAAVQIMRPSRKCTVFEGLVRPCDQRILDMLKKMLSGQSAPLRVLEISAGRSFPSADCYGAPWLARLIKQEFGERVSVLVSDSCDSKLAGFCRRIELTQSGAFRIHPAFDFGRPEYDGLREQLVDCVNDEFFGPRFCRLDRRWMEAAEKAAGRYGTGSLFPDKDSSWFVRPVLDPVFERTIFGIEAAGLTPMHFIPRLFRGQTFDFIFGRHLEPWYKESQEVFEALLPLLSRNGKGLVHIGGLGRSRDTYFSFDRTGLRAERPDGRRHD